MTTSQSNVRSAENFQTLDTVFCDSLQVLEQAQAAGLSPRARILTTSPALCLALPDRAVSLEDRMCVENVDRFFETAGDYTQTVFDAVNPIPEFHNLALTCARHAMTIQSLINKSAGLEAADFVTPRGILSMQTRNSISDTRMNPPWASLLSGNPDLTIRSFPVKMTQERGDAGGSPLSLATRLRFSSIEGIVYRILLAFWKYVPTILSRGELLILSEGELVKETVCHLAVRGYALRKISRPGRVEFQDDKLLSETQKDALKSILSPIIETRVLSLGLPDIVAPILDQYFASLFDDLDAQCATKSAWAQTLGQRTRAVVTGYPTGGAAIALSEVCRDNKIPFIAFQHGVDRETIAAQDAHQANFENSIADQFFTYNDRGKRLSDNNPYAVTGEVHAIGFPKDHFRVAENRPGQAAAPILYASTAVCRGNVQQRIDSTTDLTMAEKEIELVNTVFSGLPHRIDFKPYLSLRYPDPDPVLAAVNQQPNTRLVGEGVDLRYLLEKYKVIITSRATSTIGWCLMTKKPIIFLEEPMYFALRPEARLAFEKATFFFDTQDADWMTHLREFLLQPLSQIQDAWAEKADDHGRLIQDFSTVPEPGAGKRGARIIDNIIRSPAHQSSFASPQV